MVGTSTTARLEANTTRSALTELGEPGCSGLTGVEQSWIVCLVG